jgi:O-antigen/teichoic acid export membrane protein
VWGVATAAALHVGLCVLLIPPLGIVGGALATMVSYLAYALLLHALSQRVRRLRFHHGRMALLVVAALAELQLTSRALPGSGPALSAVRSLLFLAVFAATAWLVRGAGPRRVVLAPAAGHAS